MGPIEQRRVDNGWAHGPYDLGHAVFLGEVFADEGNDDDFLAKFQELYGTSGNVHSLGPADVGVEGASQVVLIDLSFIERPTMVLVLADVEPLFSGFSGLRSTLLDAAD